MYKDNEREHYTIQEIAELLGITLEEAFELAKREDFPETELVQIVVVMVPVKPFVEWLTAQADNKEDSNE